MNVLRIFAVSTVAILVIAFMAARYLLGPEPVPETSDYAIDRAELKYMAHAIPGPLPVRVNHQRIAIAQMPRSAIFSGFDFTPHDMAHGAYQVVYADGSYVLIDAGFSREIFDEMTMGSEEASYDDAAFTALVEALPGARAIVLTHEHLDHIQGLGAAKDLGAVAERIVMPAAQHTNPETANLLPAELLEGISPIRYTGIKPIAPGVLVQPAAGHTPGSQLVYVRTQDDREFLFIGDVAWHMDAIRELAYRPRLVTDLFLGEDRAAVMAQFRTLHDLLDDPRLTIVSSHDLDQLDELQTSGLLGKGLELP
jgi:glyoxylase-like metal-dependent hydrolase (beta-lactamase superfamily II)